MRANECLVRVCRIRGFDGQEIALPSWTAAQAEDWLGHERIEPCGFLKAICRQWPGRHLEAGGFPPLCCVVGDVTGRVAGVWPIGTGPPGHPD